MSEYRGPYLTDIADVHAYEFAAAAGRDYPPVSEAEFQSALVAFAKSRGWLVWHTPDSRRTSAGEPDLRLVRPPRVIFAELKTAKTGLRGDQLDARSALEKCPGVEYYLWRPQHARTSSTTCTDVSSDPLRAKYLPSCELASSLGR